MGALNIEAIAWREGPYWALEVPGIGVTQVHWLADAEWMARDLVACMKDVPAEAVTVTVHRGIGPVQDPGPATFQGWFWAVAGGVKDRFKRLSARPV